MIHFFDGSHVKMPDSGLFSDWIGNNANDLRRFDWPKLMMQFDTGYKLQKRQTGSLFK